MYICIFLCLFLAVVSVNLIDDIISRRGTVCDICEGPDGSSFRRHPPSHALDGDTSTWWQSPTLAAGEQYKHVELITTLPDVSKTCIFLN